MTSQTQLTILPPPATIFSFSESSWGSLKEGARRSPGEKKGDVMVEQEVAERRQKTGGEGRPWRRESLKMLVLKMEQAMGAASRSWKAHR